MVVTGRLRRAAAGDGGTASATVKEKRTPRTMTPGTTPGRATPASGPIIRQAHLVAETDEVGNPPEPSSPRGLA